MIISKSRNFAYIHIEKTGGTSIEEALIPYLNKDDLVFGGNISDYKTLEKKLFWKHTDANEMKNYLGSEWNNIYKFATVRDPKEIMISFYFYIKKNIQHLLPELILDVVYDPTFKEEIKVKGSIIYTDDLRYLYFIQSIIDNSGIDGFIYKMIKNKIKDVDPQLSKVDNTVELFDLSDIDNNWKIILNKIGINHNIQLPFINKSNRPQKIILQSKTLELIHNHFNVDYAIIPNLTGVNWI
jgi:hypothetical protein